MRVRDRKPRGVTAVLVVVVLCVVGGFMALALNVGHLMMVRGQLQNGADAAALAAARDLNGTAAGIVAARSTAVDYAGRHNTDATERIVIDPTTDVVFGNWNYSTRTFDSTVTDPALVNAVRVRTARENADGTAVPIYARFIDGPATVDVGARATAAAGVPCTADCPVPFALPDCMLYDASGNIDCSAQRVFNNDIVDNICFTNLTDMTVGDPPDPITGAPGNPNEPAGTPPFPNCQNASNNCVVKILNTNTCASVDPGDESGIMNGADDNQQVAGALQAYIQAKTGDPWAKLDVVAPIIYSPNCKCNQNAYVRGFAKFSIQVVKNPTNPSKLLISFGHKCWEYSGGQAGNCDYFGTSTVADVRLVE